MYVDILCYYCITILYKWICSIVEYLIARNLIHDNLFSFGYQQLYSCPPKWYYLLVKNTDTQEELVNESFTYFPYELSHLTPYTSLTVTIRHNDDTLFSKEIHTLEGGEFDYVLQMRVYTWKERFC